MGANGTGADLRGDTIAAVATAPGRGAVALVRLSGSHAREIARRLGATGPLEPRVATRVQLHECDTLGAPLDDALVTHYPAPHSATGEDVVEFSVHGGRIVPAAVLAATITAGARSALAGEFTERAVRNGKLDLLQAEAIADLVDARSRAMQRAALRQLGGALSRRLGELRASLLEIEALIAYEIDFPEEDDGPQPRARATRASEAVLADLDVLLATWPAATLERDGVTVVLAGLPNVGKSSLFNLLAGERRAIVSDVPGTTRDAIEALVEHEPFPLRFVDTAGIRESADVVERLGVEVSEQRLASAHVVLVCGDSEPRLRDAIETISALSAAPRIAIQTKADEHREPWLVPAALRARCAATVAVSATTGEGVETLWDALSRVVRATQPDPVEEGAGVTRARHVAALRAAREEIEAFRCAWDAGALPAPVAATHVRAAVHQLDELHGGIDVEEILERVFRSFCVGK